MDLAALTWELLKSAGIGFWLTNRQHLDDLITKLARAQYLANKNPNDCLLLYIVRGAIDLPVLRSVPGAHSSAPLQWQALQRKEVVLGLFRIAPKLKGVRAFQPSFDFARARLNLGRSLSRAARCTISWPTTSRSPSSRPWPSRTPTPLSPRRISVPYPPLALAAFACQVVTTSVCRVAELAAAFFLLAGSVQ